MFVTVRAEVYADTSGAYAELPVLLTPAGVLEPLVDYFLSRTRDRSLMWLTKVVRSIRMFLEYLNSNPAERDKKRELYMQFLKFCEAQPGLTAFEYPKDKTAWLPRIAEHFTGFQAASDARLPAEQSCLRH